MRVGVNFKVTNFEFWEMILNKKLEINFECLNIWDLVTTATYKHQRQV